MGRPAGKSVGLALEAAQTAASAINVLDQKIDKLKDHHRLLFESIMSGDDEVTAAIRSGNQKWFTGITKRVETVDGRMVFTSALTLKSLEELTVASRERLNKICAANIRNLTGTHDYREFTLPIREYIKRYAPMALGTVVKLSQEAKKEEVMLKAATDLLDRAGEREPEPEKEIIVPVQVNIVLTDDKGKKVEYVG